MDMRYLINRLNYYTDLYDQGHPEISDKEWDELYFALKQEEAETGVIYPDSPTQHIHYDSVSKLNKVIHDHPMLSLDKTKDIQEVNEFLQAQPFVAMFKMDGLTCSLTYEHGKLIKAETRGNGIVGEDILHNAKVVKNIPLEIPYEERLVVDGEIICCKDDFIPFQKEYKNPRNFASGSIRLLSSEECKKRNLSFVAWEMIEGYPNVKEFWWRLELLYRDGFTIVPMICDKQEADEALKDIQEQFKEEHAIYPIDGYVFKFDDVDFGKKQGQTDHHLKNAIAYKLYDELYDTHLKNIEWTMGRTGILTPVAIYDSIEIEGTVCNRASLHNYSIMKELFHNQVPIVNQEITVFKSNQIIPQIKSVKKYEIKDNEEYQFLPAPIICPYCGKHTKIKQDNDSQFLYCDNPNCESRLINKLEHFFGKKGLDVKGLSKATFEKLINWGWVNELFDVFLLPNYKNDWINKSGFGIKSVEKILSAIEEKREGILLENYISAIGIPLVGVAAAKEISKHFNTYDEFRKAVDDKEYIFDYPGFGTEINTQIKNFNYREADEIAIHFIDFKEKESIEEIEINNKLKDKIVVITGKLSIVKNRAELVDKIQSCGGKVSNSVSKKTDILINNDTTSTSSKNLAAQKLNIPIMSEKEFIEKFLDN